MLNSQYSVDGLYQHEEHENNAHDGMWVSGHLPSSLGNYKDHYEASNSQQSGRYLREVEEDEKKMK